MGCGLSKKVVFSLIIAALVIPLVSGQGFLTDTLSSFIDINVGSFYQNNSSIIDFFIYLIIFLGVARIVFEKQYGYKTGTKALVIGIGFALALAMTWFEYTSGFNLGSLGPWAAVIIVLLLAYIIYNLVKEMLNGATYCAVAFAYLFAYLLIKGLIPNIADQYRTVWGFMSLGFIVALILAIICVINAIRQVGGGEGGRDGRDGGGEGGRDGRDGGGRPRLNAIIASPANNQNFAPSDDINFAGEAAGGSGTYTDWIWTIDGTARSGNRVFTNSPNGLGLALGTHNITLTVRDSDGQTAVARIRINVGTGSGPGTALTAIINAPTDGQTFAVTEDVSFQGDATGGSGTYTNWIWRLNGHPFVNVQSFTRTAGFLPVGTYHISLQVRDNAGNISPETEITINIITVGPVPSLTVAIQSPSAGAANNFGPDDNIHLRGIANGGTAPYSWKWMIIDNGGDVVDIIDIPYSPLGNIVDLNTTPNNHHLVTGDYSLVLQVTDHTGLNRVSNPVDFNVGGVTLPVTPLSVVIEYPKNHEEFTLDEAIEFRGVANGGSNNYNYWDWYLYDADGNVINIPIQKNKPVGNIHEFNDTPRNINLEQGKAYILYLRIVDSAANDAVSNPVEIVIKEKKEEESPKLIVYTVPKKNELSIGMSERRFIGTDKPNNEVEFLIQNQGGEGRGFFVLTVHSANKEFTNSEYDRWNFEVYKGATKIREIKEGNQGTMINEPLTIKKNIRYNVKFRIPEGTKKKTIYIDLAAYGLDKTGNPIYEGDGVGFNRYKCIIEG